jgi:RNA polymerase sigma-70 factor, ECF subfamily
MARLYRQRPPMEAPILRHCYRMLGSFAEAVEVAREASDLRSANDRCLRALDHHRHLPQSEGPPSKPGQPVETFEADYWITPAPDARLFDSPAEALEKRQSVGLGFIALLQHLEPRQRAVLLLRDIAGWRAAEVAKALGASASAVNSSLRRARQALEKADEAAADEEPSPHVLASYVRAWKERDAEALEMLLHRDAAFAMPPQATWYRGRRDFVQFVQTVWKSRQRIRATRANGCPALLFERSNQLQVVRFARGKVVEAITFNGDFAGY